MYLACLSLILTATAYASAAKAQTQTLQFPMDYYAGHFREHCLKLQANQTLQLVISSRYPVQLNLHHHERSETTFLLDELIESTRKASVAIPAAGEYCLEVSNPETRPSTFEVRLDLRLSSA